VRFTKLRLAGFKSFVEPTEFHIQPGLTGIVGPNGCGKSNLVEALRWVMGETSAKQMRGGGMEDVIFNGTDVRPARNIATVSLSLDNSDRLAPARFNDDDELDITRHIERGEGSNYTVNGQDVRARDVQLMFADFATGAHSSALVGQGRVNDLINAKPVKRRGLLEEAAGITGLHARRHEAELRLRGAETNMERLQDVVGTLETQLQGLKRQARQANRYRRIADSLRQAEALLFHLRWSLAAEAVTAAEERLNIANSEVGEHTGAVAAATTARAEGAEQLPPLRNAEAERAAALHRLAVARERLDDEERQVAATREALAARLAQISADLQREETLATDARSALEELENERAAIGAASAGDADAERIAAEERDAARNAVSALEEDAARLTETVAATQARRNDLTRRIEEFGARASRLQAEHEKLSAEQAELSAASDSVAALDEAGAKTEATRESVVAARSNTETTARARDAAQAAELAARDSAQSAEARLARLKAEAEAILNMLGHQAHGAPPGIIDGVSVEPGYEGALGAALGEDLDAPSDESASIHWTALPAYDAAPALPDGAAPLSNFVEAPPALARRLSQIGVVAEQDGPRLRANLQTGQRLVSQDGALWRWDGYTVRPEAPTPAASRLKQRNRLAALEGEITEAEARQSAAAASIATATADREQAAAQAEAARRASDDAAEAHNQARDHQTELATEAAAQVSRLEALNDALQRIGGEITECETDGATAIAELEGMPSLDAGRADLAARREALAVARGVLEEKSRTHDGIAREASARAARLQALDREQQTWTVRTEGATSRLAELAERKSSVESEQAGLADRPGEIAEQRRALLDEIERAEADRRTAADALATAETMLETREATLKSAERALASARESMVREEGILEQARQAVSATASQIRERLECQPHEALALADPKDTASLPSAEAMDTRIQRLTRERENIGPVNLRAEAEAAEIEEQINMLVTEREDLEAAIARLRQGISSLNREGRERILAAFGEIDGHFQELFTKLFGGGYAHLQMVGSDDPLEAGLEIMASPPGKKLQALSLFSGGEKALTATALIFAAFLTNPAPICVLDEVDAPLDDSNVGRFCEMVSDLAKSTNTRFIVITHHRMTMARVDRLFGVTMAERGVSQLVSVDLDEADRWRQTA